MSRWRTVYKVRVLVGHSMFVGVEPNKQCWAIGPVPTGSTVFSVEVMKDCWCVGVEGQDIEVLYSAVEHPHGGDEYGHIEFDYMVDQEIPLGER